MEGSDPVRSLVSRPSCISTPDDCVITDSSKVSCYTEVKIDQLNSGPGKSPSRAPSAADRHLSDEKCPRSRFFATRICFIPCLASLNTGSFDAFYGCRSSYFGILVLRIPEPRIVLTSKQRAHENRINGGSDSKSRYEETKPWSYLDRSQKNSRSRSLTL